MKWIDSPQFPLAELGFFVRGTMKWLFAEAFQKQKIY